MAVASMLAALLAVYPSSMAAATYADLGVSGVTSNSATVRFNNLSNVTNSNSWAYKQSQGSCTSVTGQEVTITDLESNTTYGYEIHLSADCTDVYPFGVAFQTLPETPDPPKLVQRSTTSSNVGVVAIENWYENSGGTFWYKHQSLPTHLFAPKTQTRASALT